MRYADSIFTLALASVAVAQDAQVIHVGSKDGKASLVFDPPSVKAANGTVVTFIFDGAPGNHTVAQSSFAKPCEPLPNGFDSGFIFVPQTATTDFPTFNITISDDSKPIWFYCAQGGATPPKSAHCLNGMVGAINAPAQGNTFESYAAVASAAASVVLPVPALSGVNAFATAAPLITGSFSGVANPTGTAPAPAQSGSDPSAISSLAQTSLLASGQTINRSASNSATMTQVNPISTADRGDCSSRKPVSQGLLAFFAAALALGVAVNLAGLLCLFQIWRGRRRQNTPSLTRKISPFA